MLKQNSSHSIRSAGERLLNAAMSFSSSSDDETTTQVKMRTTATTARHSHSNTFPFGRASLSPPPPALTAMNANSMTTTTTTTTGIAARLDAAVAAAKPVNRSADLVPLTQDYYKMKKQLISMTNAARVYHSSMLKMNEARREVRVHFVFFFVLPLFYLLLKAMC
jgi:hypothetical protein